MNREEKTVVVDELAERLEQSQAIFAVDYKGITVTQAAELRAKLRESDASFRVVKNRLAKLAAAKAGTGDLDELLTGPIALALIDGDPVIVAKTITNFTKEHEVLEYKGGIMDGAPLEIDSFQAIARLPGLDVLHGQLVGLAASPLTGLVAGMSNLISGLGRQLAQIAEQGLVTGEAPAAEEPAAQEEPEAEPAAEAPEPEAPVEEPTPADEPAPDEAPVEEPPAEEEAPEPEAEASSDATETETENDNPEEVEAEGETSEGSEVEAEGETSEGTDTQED